MFTTSEMGLNKLFWNKKEITKNEIIYNTININRDKTRLKKLRKQNIFSLQTSPAFEGSQQSQIVHFNCFPQVLLIKISVILLFDIIYSVKYLKKTEFEQYYGTSLSINHKSFLTNLNEIQTKMRKIQLWHTLLH